MNSNEMNYILNRFIKVNHSNQYVSINDKYINIFNVDSVDIERFNTFLDLVGIGEISYRLNDINPNSIRFFITIPDAKFTELKGKCKSIVQPLFPVLKLDNTIYKTDESKQFFLSNKANDKNLLLLIHVNNDFNTDNINDFIVELTDKDVHLNSTYFKNQYTHRHLDTCIKLAQHNSTKKYVLETLIPPPNIITNIPQPLPETYKHFTSNNSYIPYKQLLIKSIMSSGRTHITHKSHTSSPLSTTVTTVKGGTRRIKHRHGRNIGIRRNNKRRTHKRKKNVIKNIHNTRKNVHNVKHRRK